VLLAVMVISNGDQQCMVQEAEGFDLPSVQLAHRRKKFLEKFEHYRESLLR